MGSCAGKRALMHRSMLWVRCFEMDVLRVSLNPVFDMFGQSLYNMQAM